MTAGERLISLSSIAVCDTAQNHFCSIVLGAIINRVYGSYDVKYIKTEKSKIKYFRPPTLDVKYIAPKTIDISYIMPEKQAIKYVASPTIKTKLI